MDLKVIGTGSKGNLYVLTDDEGYSLILEAGMSLSEVKKHLDFDLTKVIGLLCTHSHMDHSKYLKDFASAGIQCYLSEETSKARGLKSHRTTIVKELKKFEMDRWEIMPFDVHHDVHCLGFLLKHKPTGNKIMFLTDSYFCKYSFKGVNNFIIEANYSEKIIDEKMYSGESHKFLRDRIIESHMSLETTCELLSKNDLTKTNNIVLIHLSDTNSNARKFQETVSNQTAKTVTVAENGLNIPLGITPF